MAPDPDSTHLADTHETLTAHTSIDAVEADSSDIDVAAQEARAWSLAVSAAELGAAGDTTGAAETARESVTLYAALYPLVGDAQRADMANQVLSTAGYLPPAEAVPAVENAVQVFRDLHNAQPEDTARRNGLAWALAVLTAQRANNHDTAGATETARESVTLYTALLNVVTVAEKVAILQQMASTSGYLPADEALTPVKRGVEELRILVDEDPANGSFRDTLAWLLAVYDARLVTAGQPAGAAGVGAELLARSTLRDLGYSTTTDGTGLTFTRSLDAYERIWRLTPTAGMDIGVRALAVAESLEGRWCAVPDAIGVGADGELHLQSYGPTHGRWRKSTLRYRYDTANSGLSEPDVAGALAKAFGLWAAVSPGYFRFINVHDNPDIEARFGGTELDPEFTGPRTRRRHRRPRHGSSHRATRNDRDRGPATHAGRHPRHQRGDRLVTLPPPPPTGARKLSPPV